ncbi:hypothetical protein [Fusobacterium sp.]|uniref:hypothetical protein n=1 Tax=Fusobacterium sp. TaxID=68766 RepID=UPI00396C4E8F
MKTQRVNPSTMNHMQLNSMSNMMGMMNTIQKIGKGKRKITVKLDKGDKKFLSKFIEEVKKQFSSSPMGGQTPTVAQFFDYVKSVADNKKQTELKLSFEEFEFLKRMLVDSIKGMEGMELKWYQFIKKGMLKMLSRQYRELLSKFK